MLFSLDKIDLELKKIIPAVPNKMERAFLKSCVDLTSLSSLDTQKNLSSLIALAKENAVAAVCLHSPFVSWAKKELRDTDIAVATVAAAFPHGQVALDLKLSEISWCLEAGVDEVDVVISRGALINQETNKVRDEVSQMTSIIQQRKKLIKVILETGELSPEEIYAAAKISLAAGADFIKTSTGKISVGATPLAAYLMSLAIKEHYQNTGEKRGIKVSGGVKTPGEAHYYAQIVEQVLGKEWLNKKLFRIGASSLLKEL